MTPSPRILLDPIGEIVMIKRGSFATGIGVPADYNIKRPGKFGEMLVTILHLISRHPNPLIGNCRAGVDVLQIPVGNTVFLLPPVLVS
jgi:hypothetical protein